MLVSTRKLFLLFLFFSIGLSVQGQEVWTLDQCLDTARTYNKQLQMNRNSLSLSEEREKEAKANLLPKLSVNADYKYFLELPHQLMPVSALNPQALEGEFREIQFGVPHNLNANLQLAMPLYNPQLFGGIKNTKIASELSQLQYNKTEEQVLYDITTLYYNGQILKHQLVFIDSNLINTNRLLKNLQLLHEQLLATGTDVNKVKLQSDQLATQKEILQNKYTGILNALKLNMGVSLEKNLEVEMKVNHPELSAGTSHLNTDLQIIKVQNKLLISELKTLQQTQYLPSLNLIASYGTAGFGYDKNPDEFLKFYPVSFAGIQLSYPLFNGTITHRKINQKKWEIKNNQLQSQLIDEKNSMEIDNATRQRKTALRSIANTENQIRQAQTIYDQTILQQKQGLANLTDVLLADHDLREVQQNYLSALIDYLKSDLDMKRLKGELRIKN